MDRYLEIGVDIVDIEQFKLKISRGTHSFLKKVYTEQEQLFCEQFADPVRHYAGLFAAKEAIFKALNKKLHVPLWKIEISHTDTGQPEINLPDQIDVNQRDMQLYAKVSISHDQSKAMAFAIVYETHENGEHIAQLLDGIAVLG